MGKLFPQFGEYLLDVLLVGASQPDNALALAHFGHAEGFHSSPPVLGEKGPTTKKSHPLPCWLTRTALLCDVVDS
jgi:hypothetical protein